MCQATTAMKNAESNFFYTKFDSIKTVRARKASCLSVDSVSLMKKYVEKIQM